MSKLHYIVYEPEPNESDPEGYGYILCGRDTVDRFTTSMAFTDCKDCLRRLAKRKANQEKGHAE